MAINQSFSGVYDSADISLIAKKGFEKAYTSLEFDKITEMLCTCTSVEGAQNILKQITPSVSLENIRYMQKQRLSPMP